jgi:hypothetical protein
MPILSEAQRLALQKQTRNAAEALLEDLQHFRSLMNRRETSRSELRHLSTTVRRLLSDGELAKIAVPRIGKLTLNAPDYHPLYEVAARAASVQFIGGAGTRIFGQRIGPNSLMRFRNHPISENVEDYVRRMGTPSVPFDAEKRISLRLPNFLSQKVLCYETEWISRGSVIRYVANLGEAYPSDSG